MFRHLVFRLETSFHIKEKPVTRFPNFHGGQYWQTTTQYQWYACPTIPLHCSHVLCAVQQDIDTSTLTCDFAKLIFPFHFTSVFSMRLMMVHTGAVLSGSAALALLHGNKFEPNDLDFYVTAFGFSGILEFVLNHGYKIEPNVFSNQYSANPHLIVVKLAHPVSQKTINIMTCLESHVIGMITAFHSTLVMNFVSWYGLVSLYPDWTLRSVGLIINDTPSTRVCFQKYSERGFVLYQNICDLAPFTPQHRCREDPCCPATQRSLLTDCLLKPFRGCSNDLAEHDAPVRWILPLACKWKLVLDSDP